MDDALKQKWIGALRSGKYKQSAEVLWSDYYVNPDPHANENMIEGEGYCCLGVLCEIQGFEREDDGQYYVPADWSIIPDGYLIDVAEEDIYVRDGKPYILAQGELPTPTKKEYGMDKRVKHQGKSMDLQSKLMMMNDGGKSFDEIANYLEKVQF